MKKVCKKVLFFSAVIFSIWPSVTKGELLYGVSACKVSQYRWTQVNTGADGPPYVIAIDPGHGGMDTGALAIAKEYIVIDTTSVKLYDLLERDGDFLPIFTRTDTDPESGQRAAAAAEAGARLLISIHANSDSHKSSHGFECFPTPPGRLHHTDSLRFATLIASEMKNAGHTLRGESKTGVKYAYYNGKNKKIVDSSDDKIRSMKSFGILEKATCPAVLVEQCFITNYRDVNNWTGEEGCTKAAKRYYNAIKQYFANRQAANI